MGRVRTSRSRTLWCWLTAWVRQARERVHRYYTAKPAASGIQCVVVANHPAPHDRTRAVGSDDEVGFDRAAIIETQRRMRTAVVDVDKALAQVNAIHADGRGQDRLQLGAMNADVRCPETLSIGWPRVMFANEPPRAAIPVDQR